MSLWMVLLLVTLPVPWIAKIIWPHEIKLIEIALVSLVTALVISFVYALGVYGQTYDVEIWNGKITGKTREHGHYQQAYSCNCRETCSGTGSSRSCSTTCDTCYEDRYTVDWTANSTIGSFRIDRKDWSSRAVYLLPDPKRYTEINKDDPCSDRRSFTNYVRAVPESLFHANPLLSKKYAGMIPNYPDDIYDIYHINRVFGVGFNLPESKQWNQALSHSLKDLGTGKQANAIVLFVKGAEPDYQYALESAWVGGKKNDIIILIGISEWPNIQWAAVSSWTKSEIFKVQLRDDIMALEKVDRAQVLALFEKHTAQSFQRREMKEFEYLKDEIEPPMWVIILALILGLAASFGLSYYCYREDPFNGAFDSWQRRSKRY